MQRNLSAEKDQEGYGRKLPSWLLVKTNPNQSSSSRQTKVINSKTKQKY